MIYSWIATEARTGVVIADLPLLSVDSVKLSMGRYETQSATLPLPEAPENWERTTMPGATHLILLRDNPNDPAHGIPLIGYLINRRTRTEGDTIALDLATVEAYFDTRYVGDKSYVQVGQNEIVADLINTYIVPDGIPIRVQYTGAGKLRDRNDIKDASDKTVYSVVTDLSGVAGGPEWTVGWEWQHDPERLTPVAYVGDRIGNAATDGLNPAATFEIPGSVKSFSIPEDFSSGKGATDVMAVSTAEGDVRPQSTHHVSTDPDRPRREFRFTPSTSISETTTLDDYATAALANMKDGAVSLALSSVASDGPQLGTDFSIGDDVGFVIGGIRSDGKPSVPSYPRGIQGTARCMGWELTLGATGILTPALVDPVLEA